MSLYISKTDFKIGSSCPKKLWYKKHNYPTTNDENEYMQFLSKGGYMVGKMAQLIYEGGTDLSGIADWQTAAAETRRLIESNENIIIYETSFYSNNKLARVDILKKEGRTLSIIEVKAKSQDSDDEKEKIPDEYLEDVLFQVLTAEESFPGYNVKGFLLMPDKNKLNKIEGLGGWFVEEEGEYTLIHELEELPARNDTELLLPNVRFRYENDPQKEQYLQQLRLNSILELRDIKTTDFGGDWEAAKVSVKNRVQLLYEGLVNNVNGTLDKKCKSCEYQSDNIGMNGFKECWRDYEGKDLSALELYYGGSVKLNKEKFYVDHLIENKTVSLLDVDPTILTRGKASEDLSNRTIRQLLQVVAAQTGEEQIRKDVLKKEMEHWEFPLYFIDFETFTGAIPFHEKMHSYEIISFQWSCHKINSPNGKLEHFEWINLEEDFPNFRFAESLMNLISNSGTPLMWSHHENTVLRHILQQMEIHQNNNSKLKNWLTKMTHDKILKREGRLVDMAKLCEKTYLHPDCKGKVSIKKILPAIWNNHKNHELHNDFEKYFKKDGDGNIIDPYKTLSPAEEFLEITELETEEVISDGTAAMKAYFELMHGKGRNNHNKKEEIKKLLLQYCELDTAAMAIIYKYWQTLIL